MTEPDYEQSILGCIINDNAVLEEHKITSSLFAEPINQRIYEAIIGIRARGAVADLREVGLACPDVASYSASLTSLGSHVNASFYHSRLSEAMRKRGILKIARVIGSMAHTEESGDIFDYIDRELCALSILAEPGYKHISKYCAEAAAEIEAAYKSKGKLTGIPTGFEELDQKTDGLQKQELMVIGARPGTGKTSLALNLSTAAIKAGKCVGFFSVEMKGSAIAKRLIAEWSSVNMRAIKTGLMSTSALSNITESIGRLVGSKYYINDQPCIPLHDLMSEARRMKRKEGIDVLFIDYLSLVGNESRSIHRHEQVADISKNLKRLARELDVPVVVLSQLNRDAQNGRPNIAQLRDSGAVEQDADIIALLWHQGWLDEKTKEHVKITFCLDKNRNGVVGDINMIFRPAIMRFAQEEFDGR